MADIALRDTRAVASVTLQPLMALMPNVGMLGRFVLTAVENGNQMPFSIQFCPEQWFALLNLHVLEQGTALGSE
jgi:hypothetical protein